MMSAKLATLEFKILHQCGKSVKSKGQKVLEAYSNVCRSYRRETPILNRVKSFGNKWRNSYIPVTRIYSNIASFHLGERKIW